MTFLSKYDVHIDVLIVALLITTIFSFAYGYSIGEDDGYKAGHFVGYRDGIAKGQIECLGWVLNGTAWNDYTGFNLSSCHEIDQDNPDFVLRLKCDDRRVRP